MKEAFGGTFMLKLVMVFFVIYVTFLGVALNIAKAYRIKNGVINIIEQQQYDMSDSSDTSTYILINNYLSSIPYNVSKTSIDDNCKAAASKVSDYPNNYKSDSGICVIKNPGNYYKVTVYMYAEFPFLDIHLILPISGETMSMIK